MQTGVAISGTNITGTLKYVTGYTGFSSKTVEQSGNYLVLHFTTPGVEGAKITVKVTKSSVLDSDGIIVLRIADKDSQTVTVVAEKEGYETTTTVYSLTGLTCEAESVTETPAEETSVEPNNG